MVKTPNKKPKRKNGEAVAFASDKLKTFTIRLPNPLYASLREYCWHNVLSIQEVARRAFAAFMDAAPAAAVKAHDFADTSAAEREVLRSCLDLLRAGPGANQSRDILIAVSRNWRRYIE